MKLILLIALFCSSACNSAWAAAGAATHYEIRATATSANANAGGFNPAATLTLNNLATDTNTANTASPIVGSASYNFLAGDVGAWLFIQSGTSWQPSCWFQIASVASNKATLSAAIGAGICRISTQGFPAPRLLATTVAGVTSDNTATLTGGVFSIDYSQQDAAQFSGTDLASSNGSTAPCAVSSATHTFIPTDVGNFIHVTAGTSWTQGWYEIVSVSAGAATLDRACGSTASISSGTYKLGGAISLGSSTANQTDSNFFSGTHVAAGNRFLMKLGTYSPPAAVAGGTGSASAPISLEGYQTLRGDAPGGTNRPTINMGANTFTAGGRNTFYNLNVTGTAASVLTLGTASVVINCKGINTSTTANRIAITMAASAWVYYSEAISYRGYAIATANATTQIIQGSYIHDSVVGIRLTFAQAGLTILDNIIESNVTAAIQLPTGTIATGAIISGNTLVGGYKSGGSAKTGIGIDFATGVSSARILNNIITGFATGINHADTQTEVWADFNDFYNNTVDVTNVQRGAHGISLDPGFTDVGQISGSAGAFTAANDRLVDTTKNFSSLGVTAGRDFIYIISGTGATAGQYRVTAFATTTNPNDTLVLDIAPGTSTVTDKAYQITIGRNFAAGANIKAVGFPGVFPAGLTTGYRDIGAVQRVEPSGSGGGQKGYIQ